MPKKRGHGQGGLFKLKDRGLWRGVAHWVDEETGTRKAAYVHSKSQREASRKLDELRAEIKEHGAPLDRNTTVAQWLPKWLREYHADNIDPKTRNGYSTAITKWIVPTIGAKKVSALKPSDVNAVYRKIKSEGKSASTVRNAKVVLNKALEQARAEGLCTRNVAADVITVRKRGADAAKKRDSLGLAQASHVLELVASNLPDRIDGKGEFLPASYWWFKLLGGPRQTESLAMLLEDLDLGAPSYRVYWKLEELAKDHGCGEASEGAHRCGKTQGAACTDWTWRIPVDFDMVHLFGRWCLTRPKSQTGRYVPLIEEVAEMIQQDIERYADRPNPYGLVWRKADGRPFETKEEAQMWREVLYAAGIITKEQAAVGKSPIDGHCARHTTVSLLMMLTGGDAQLVGEIVGHSSREVTEIYRHADQSEKHAAIKRLGQTVIAGRPLAISA